MSVMSDEGCWDFLRSHEFGRLAFHLGGQVHIAPINYAVHHDPATGRKTLLFRTAAGGKLEGVVANDDVAFEVDEYDSEHAASVIVRGRARMLEEHEEHRADNVPLRPWVGSSKLEVMEHHFVEIDITELSGRRFELNRPWLHMRPE